MVRWMIFSILATGCVQPDFVTSNGVQVYLNGDRGPHWTKEKFDAVDARWLPELKEVDSRFEGAERHMPGVNVFVESEPIPCPWIGGDGKCAGIQDGPNLRIEIGVCPDSSSYAHEMLHWLELKVLGVVSYEHDTPQWATVYRLQCGEP